MGCSAPIFPLRTALPPPEEVEEAGVVSSAWVRAEESGTGEREKNEVCEKKEGEKGL